VLADHAREREAAELEAFETVLALVSEAVGAVLRAREGWVDRVRAGLVALLELFDEEPALARYLVVGSAQAGPAVLARRKEVLDGVALLLDDEGAPARSYPPPLTAHAVVSGVLGVLHAQLSEHPHPHPKTPRQTHHPHQTNLHTHPRPQTNQNPHHQTHKMINGAVPVHGPRAASRGVDDALESASRITEDHGLVKRPASTRLARSGSRRPVQHISPDSAGGQVLGLGRLRRSL
jgi:hypothetical protein